MKFWEITLLLIFISNFNIKINNYNIIIIMLNKLLNEVINLNYKYF